MIAAISYLALLLLIILTAWILWIRGRGSLGFWIREVARPEGWAIGRTLAGDEPESGDRAKLSEITALARSLERGSGIVIREWDHVAGSRFLGLMIDGAPDSSPEHPFELRTVPAAVVLRVSGRSNTEGVTLAQAAREFAERKGIEADFKHAVRLSGQSFWYYEWPVRYLSEGVSAAEPLAERVFRMRAILLFPLLMGCFSVALIGTGSAGLFATGVLLMIFLSGACKFVFVYQREDESQEEHLQNY